MYLKLAGAAALLLAMTMGVLAQNAPAVDCAEHNKRVAAMATLMKNMSENSRLVKEAGNPATTIYCGRGCMGGLAGYQDNMTQQVASAYGLVMAAATKAGCTVETK